MSASGLTVTCVPLSAGTRVPIIGSGNPRESGRSTEQWSRPRSLRHRASRSPAESVAGADSETR